MEEEAISLLESPLAVSGGTETMGGRSEATQSLAELRNVIAHRIMWFREFRGLTQAQLAFLAGYQPVGGQRRGIGSGADYSPVSARAGCSSRHKSGSTSGLHGSSGRDAARV